MSINTIIFDLGGVLIDWNPRYLYRKLFDKEEDMEYFLANICTGDWNEQQDAGRALEEATQLLVNQYPSQADLIKAFYGRWTEMINGSIQGTVDILEQLHQDQRYPLYALTNWSAETFPYALANFPFLQYFKGIVVSGEEKLKKPDRRIYDLILNRYNIDSSKAVFIDDSLKNINGAKAVGLHTIHFQSPQQLKEELLEMGVVV